MKNVFPIMQIQEVKILVLIIKENLQERNKLLRQRGDLIKCEQDLILVDILKILIAC